MPNPTHRLLLCAFAAAGLAGTPALAEDSDAEFVKKAASGGMLEVELGRHAATNASSPSVRAFGERMASDHGKANQELKDVARREGIAIPTTMAEDHRETLDELTKLRGRELDEAYMKAMVDDHEADVEAFREQAEQPKSEVDRFAAKTLPTLEAHLAQAKLIAEDVRGSGVGAGNPADAGRALDPGVTGGAGRP